MMTEKAIFDIDDAFEGASTVWRRIMVGVLNSVIISSDHLRPNRNFLINLPSSTRGR